MAPVGTPCAEPAAVTGIHMLLTSGSGHPHEETEHTHETQPRSPRV